MNEKQQIITNFSKSAPHYERFSTIQRRVFLSLIAPMIQGGEFSLKKEEGALKTYLNILDIGCATGGNTKILLEYLPESRILGIDISKKMIQTAKETFQDSRLTFETADIEDYSEQGLYDLIVSNATFQWLNNLPETLKNLKNALKPQGRIAFSYFGPQTFQELQTLFKQEPLSSKQFYSIEQLHSILKRGFSNVSIKESRYTLKYQSVKELLRTIKYTGTRGAATASRGLWTPSVLFQLENKYLEAYNEIRASYQVFYCYCS
ncbi:malonyl-ACP O-methyltransferase BioC [Thermoproteota archaeon]